MQCNAINVHGRPMDFLRMPISELIEEHRKIRTSLLSETIFEARNYLARLVISLAPGIQPMETLLEVCTQIDNWCVGARERSDRLTNVESHYEYCKQWCRDVLTGLGFEKEQPYTAKQVIARFTREPSFRNMIDYGLICQERDQLQKEAECAHNVVTQGDHTGRYVCTTCNRDMGNAYYDVCKASERAHARIQQLARFISEEIPEADYHDWTRFEPSESEGAVETAIRLLRRKALAVVKTTQGDRFVTQEELIGWQAITKAEMDSLRKRIMELEATDGTAPRIGKD